MATLLSGFFFCCILMLIALYFAAQLYTFLETILDTLALLPHFITFFGDAKNHSSSAQNLAVTFIAFGDVSLTWYHLWFYKRNTQCNNSYKLNFLDTVLNLAFSLSLLCFVVMHSSLVLSNTTTIEVIYMNYLHSLLLYLLLCKAYVILCCA